ncbi:MAG: flagellar hook-associated protein FlgL [Candidatus Riflebacteria bacterium]|nr:flagellar hook-associated protein FlgL [Candidatus Riflebacteria bacterium]
MRITNQWVYNSFVNQINRNNTSLSELQSKISSGNKYLRASENPVDNALTMEYSSEINENKQYVRNIEHTKDWYNTTDSSLTSLESIIQRIRELAIEGATDTTVEIDRDAIAKEIDQLLLEVVNIANTKVNNEYIFGGSITDQKPITYDMGQDPRYNANMVNYALGEFRDRVNITSPVNVQYHGNNVRMTSQIDNHATIEKSITGLEMFFGVDSAEKISGTPTFSYSYPPIEKSTSTCVLNNGEGVDKGLIYITDAAGIDHKIDLTTAHTIDDVIGIINDSRSFVAGIEEVPSDTAVSLGIYRNAGQSDLLIGLSDPAMRSEYTNLTDLNNGLGIAEGYLNLNTRDGNNYRVNVEGCTTVKDVLDAINSLNGGAVVNARFDMINNRIELNDLTNGKGEFSVTSIKTQLYVKDLPSHVAEDYGILQNVGTGDTMYSYYDKYIQYEADPYEFANNGDGVENGYINITGHDGNTTTVKLENIYSPTELIEAINTATGGAQVASWDTNSNRLKIVDNTIGTESFQITEYVGTDPIKIRENTTIANSLGLLKSTKGNTVIGDTLTSVGGGLVDETTLLEDLTNPPDIGFIKITGADKVGYQIDLSGCKTVGDVIKAINDDDHFAASWDASERRIVITDPRAVGGNFGLSVGENTNTAYQLGFVKGASNYQNDTITGHPLTVASLPTLEGSIDLDPVLTEETKLSDLNSNRTWNTSGVNLGIIRITDKAGHFSAIDLRGCSTVKDVLNKINDPENGIYVEARINADKNGIEIVDKNHGASGKLEVIDCDSTCAFDLGIKGRTVDNVLVGKDLDPAVTRDTLLTSCVNGSVPAGKVYVQSGEKSLEIDLTGCRTIGDVMDKLSNTDLTLHLTAWISEDGKHLNLTNTINQPYIKVVDISGEPATASALGLGSTQSLFSTLMDLRDNMLRCDEWAVSNINLPQIDEALERILIVHDEVGAKTNRVDTTKTKIESINMNLKTMLTNVEDIDMTEAIIQMSGWETTYQASLQVGARLMQTSLLDFL